MAARSTTDSGEARNAWHTGTRCSDAPQRLEDVLNGSLSCATSRSTLLRPVFTPTSDASSARLPALPRCPHRSSSRSIPATRLRTHRRVLRRLSSPATSSFGLGARLSCTVQLRRIRRISSPDIIGASVEAPATGASRGTGNGSSRAARAPLAREMGRVGSHRDEFPSGVKSVIAHRAGFRCSKPDCRALTIGPSARHSDAVSNIGVASHITAASKGGPRFDASMSTEARRSSVEWHLALPDSREGD